MEANSGFMKPKPSYEFIAENGLGIGLANLNVKGFSSDFTASVGPTL